MKSPKLHKVKLLLASLLAILNIVILGAAVLASVSSAPYLIISQVLSTVAWSIICVILVLEQRKYYVKV